MKKKLMTFNVNGIRSAWGKGLRSVIRSLDVDVACLQEIRCQDENLDSYGIAGFESYFCPSSKLGYAGVGVFSRIPVLKFYNGLTSFEWDGRVMIVEYEEYYVVNVYLLAADPDWDNDYVRARWISKLQEVVVFLESMKPVIICGDLNVDGYLTYSTHRVVTSLTSLPYRAFVCLLNAGYEDVWLMQHPSHKGATWFRYGASRSFGCRLDYFLVSERLLGKVCSCEIHDICGLSDHRPVILELDV